MAVERAGDFVRGDEHAADAAVEGERPPVGKHTLVERWVTQVEATGGWAPAQRKASGAGDAAAGPPPASGGGAPLPANLVGKLERALGGSFAAVRVHEHSYASAIGALAFARGTDLYFAPGAYDPASPRGLELLGHELTHVVQQQQGRVRATAEVGGAPLNDDAGLESEADAMGAKVAREVAPGGDAGDAPKSGGAAAAAGPVQKKADPAASAAPDAATPRCEAAPPDAAPTEGGAPIQKAPPPGKKADETLVPFYLTITKPMTLREVEDAASMQFFGITFKEWTGGKPNYTVADSPIRILFPQSLVQRYRGAAAKAKGIATTPDGSVDGADARTTDFDKEPASGDKSAVIDEIDKRYAAASGSDAKIKKGEVGKSKLWKQVRDEVLFQRQYLGNLPPSIQTVVKQNIDGKDLAPGDYDQLFRIAKKLEGLPPGATADYASKVTGTTTDLDTFESAVDKYTTDYRAREQQDKARTDIGNKLAGLEEVYKMYRSYKSVLTSEAMTSGAQMQAPAGMPMPPIITIDASGMLRTQLNAQLPRYGFANIAAFEDYITKYEDAFTEGAATLTLELLAKYAGKLYQEQQRYANPAVIQDLYGKLAPFRAQAADVQKQNGIIAKEQADRRSRDRSDIPGNGGTAPPPSAAEEAAKTQATSSFNAAKQSIADLAKEYPIFSEEELPADKRVNKQALANASQAQLGPLLLAHIGERQTAAVDARKEVEGNHAVIYKMDKLMPTFFTSLDVQSGSIHEMIIQDKMHDGAIQKIVVGVLLAVAAIALTVISMGAATPAVIAAGASIGAAGLSTYMAYDEYRQYSTDKHLANAGFADDPTVVWLVLAIVGAGVDVGLATKAVGKLAGAASALAKGGELSDFQKAVAALRESQEIDGKIAAAADKAAEARKAYDTAKQGFKSAILGKAYSFPGPLLDAEVWKSVVQMALAKIQEGGHSLLEFLADLRKLRLEAKMADLTPEELVRAKDAWAEAERLAAVVTRLEQKVTDAAQLGRLRTAVADAEQLERLLAKIPDAAKLESLLGKVGGPAQLEKLLGVFPDLAKLEGILAKIAHPEKLAGLVDALGSDSARQLVEKLAASTKPKDLTKLNNMIDRVAAGGAQIGDQGALKAGSIVPDSNVVIAKTKIAAGDPTAHAGDAARAKFLDDHAATGGDVHVGNMTTAETSVDKVGPGGTAAKGLPLEVSREAPEYRAMIAELERMKVGANKGIQDRQLVADIFYAKREPGVTPEFACADIDVYTPLAEKAGIPIPTKGQLPLTETQKAGFLVDVLGRKMKVYPLP